jgi:hypothetical protein
MDEDIEAALAGREPIFHRSEHGRTRPDFEAIMAPGYREVAASGRVFDRAFILDTLEERYADPAYDPMAGLRVDGLAVRHLDGETWQVTYDLWQGDRHTRRSTIWRRDGARWVALFHQGTVVDPAFES